MVNPTLITQTKKHAQTLLTTFVRVLMDSCFIKKLKLLNGHVKAAYITYVSF